MLKSVLVAMLSCLLIAVTLQTHTQESSAASEARVEEELAVRYAAACLTLAQADLAVATEMNRGDPPTVSDLQLARLAAQVEVAEQMLHIAKQYQYGSTKPMQLAHAETAARQADQEARRALHLHRQRPTELSQLSMERLPSQI